MIMADILFWIAVGFGLVATCIAHWLAAEALMPRVVARSAEAYARRPVASTVIGVLIAVPLATLLIAAFHAAPHPLAKALLVGLAAILLLIGLLGSAGLAMRVGLGLPSVADGDQPWRPVLRGGVVLGLVFIAPILGWFILLPLTFASGVGAWLLGRRIEV